MKIENTVSSDQATKAALWYTISNILLRGVSLFTAPIFTRLLSIADYGIVNNFSSWAAIVMCFTGLGLGTAVIRGKVEFDKDYKKYLSSIQFLGMVWCSICIAVLLAGINFWSSFMMLDNVCIIVMTAYILLSPSLTFGQIDIRFEYKYKENVAISIASTVISVFSAIGLILLWSDKRYLGRIIGLTLPTLLFGIYFVIRIFRQGRCSYNRDYWKYALKLSIPMIPHGFAMIILGQIDRVMIMKYTGESAAGIYSFGYSYAVLLSVVTNAINDSIQPQMYGMLRENREKDMAGYTYRLMLLGVLLTTGIIGIGPEALRVLGTEDYFDARWVIFPVAVGTLMQYFYQFFGLVEIYSKKTIYMAIGSCGAAFLNYVLNQIFIPQYGFLAAAYTTLVAYGLLTVFHFLTARVAYKKKVFGIVPVAVIVLIMLAVGFGLNVVYDNIVIRYALLAIVVSGMTFYLRNDILIMTRRIKKS